MSGPEGNVILRSLFHSFYFKDQVIEIRWYMNEVYLRGANHQERSLCVVKKVFVKGLIYLVQVAEIYWFFIIPTPLFDPFFQYSGFCLQKYHEIGPCNLNLQKVEYLFVQAEFSVVQVEPCKDSVLVKEEV